MAKFLSYENRLEIESGLKEDLTFTEIGKKLGVNNILWLSCMTSHKHVFRCKYLVRLRTKE
jgi:hypothetical protein